MNEMDGELDNIGQKIRALRQAKRMTVRELAKLAGVSPDPISQIEQADSITYPSTVPHKWRNVGNIAAIGIWMVSPPSF